MTDIAIQAYSYGEALGLVFFGFALLASGYLIRRSGYLPSILGTAIQLAGGGYIVNSFLLLLTEELASIVLLLPSFLAELSLAAWLVIKGVDASKWEIQARSTAAT